MNHVSSHLQDRTPASESAVSIPSVRHKKLSLYDIPWRTVDIDMANPESAAIITGGVSAPGEVQIDRWNEPSDPTFRQHIEHEKRKARVQKESETEESATEEEAMDVDGEGGGTKVTKRMILVCYHLPVILNRDASSGSWSACWSESLIAKTQRHTITSSYDTQWVGTVSTHPPIAREEEREAVRAVLAPMNCTPVFINNDVEKAHYLGMCKEVLWPCFHNVDLLDLSSSGWGQTDSAGDAIDQENANDISSESNTNSDWDQSKLDVWWSAYRAVNSMFADSLSQLVRPHDTVWIHDYHLSLLPKMVRQTELEETGKRTIEMIYFLHIPFPTSQVFRELEHGEAILEGMLNADVVGFHAFDHARHFLNASTRILGLTYESLVGGLIGVSYLRRKVLVTVSNVSIESDIVDGALALPSVQNDARALKEKHSGRTIITGVDIAQRLSGVFLKLLAYEGLLRDYPIWKDKVVMVQRCLIPGNRSADEADTLREVRGLINRISKTFGTDVIDYEEFICSTLPIDQRLSLWTSSDVLIVTPVREGFNPIPLEYVYAKKEDDVGGVVITSEFSAISSILNGALRVNPYDIQTAVTSIDKALSMSSQERESRRLRDIEFVSSCPSGTWTRNVLRDLRDATTGLNAKQGGSAAAARTQSVDAATAMLSTLSRHELPPLDIDAVKAAYDASSQRVLIIDFNGTLVMKEPPGKYLKREMLGTSGHKPPATTLRALADLCQDPRNTVLVVSGDTQKNLEGALGNIRGLGMAHSNGACYSMPLPNEMSRAWLSYDLGVDWEAVKKAALPILSKYTARTNGSFVKLTHASIGWMYNSCDPEWGALQASFLLPELERELRAFDVRFVTLKGVIEVVPKKLNKGLVAKKILEEVSNTTGGRPIDFILCMGDDVSDEKMFTSVFSFIAESNAASADSPDNLQRNKKNNGMYAFTVAVGKKKTHASYYVDSSKDVPHLLAAMSGVEIPINQQASWESEESKRDLFATNFEERGKDLFA